MSDGKEVKRYPFESFAWDDDPSNNNRWCDAAEVEAAFDKTIAELRAEVEALKTTVENNRLDHEWPIVKQLADAETTIARQERVIEKLNSRLAAFVEYFDAIKNGEYQKNRPFLRDFEEVLLLRGQEVLNELAAIERAEGEKE